MCLILCGSRVCADVQTKGAKLCNRIVNPILYFVVTSIGQ